MIYFDNVIWLPSIEEKIDRKHDVSTEEAEHVLYAKHVTRFVEEGDVSGEDLYVTYGRTRAGRYLSVFFVYKPAEFVALPISARDMSRRERRYYARHK